MGEDVCPRPWYSGHRLRCLANASIGDIMATYDEIVNSLTRAGLIHSDGDAKSLRITHAPSERCAVCRVHFRSGENVLLLQSHTFLCVDRPACNSGGTIIAEREREAIRQRMIEEAVTV